MTGEGEHANVRPVRRPSRNDPSVPREEGYAYKKEFYRSSDVAEDYDAHRLGTPLRRRRYRRQWALVRDALADMEGIRRILDLPCGTGRYTGRLAAAGYRVVGADISREMMQKAREKADGAGVLGYVQTDAEKLALGDDTVDCVVAIRFTFHVDPATRVRILREMKRVSRRWVLLDYRHRYTWRWVKRWFARKLGLDDRPFPRVSRRGLEREFREAGLRVSRVIRGGTPGFSDKWIVVGEPDDPEPPGSLLEGTGLADVEVLDRIGEGARTVVHRARWRGREAVLKLYKPRAVARHARRHRLPLAEYEFERNRRFHRAPGLGRYVAEPLGRVVTGRGQALLQERIEGLPYRVYREGADEAEAARLFARIERLVDLAHEAGLYEIDIHPHNVLVARDEGGEPVPKLFDFNVVPLGGRRRNPVGWLVRMRLVGRRRRDRRHLRRFRDPPAYARGAPDG